MEKIVQNHELHACVISNYVNTWTSRGKVLARFNNSIFKIVESFGCGNSSLRIYITEKSKISASFLRADVRDGGESKIFNYCDLLLCCIHSFFVKHTERPVIYIWQTSAQWDGQSNAATLNLLKSNSLRVGVFFGSAFAVDLAGVTKLFFVILSETSFLHPISHVSINRLYCFWLISGIESTKARTSSLYVISVPSLINQSSKNGLTGSNLPVAVVNLSWTWHCV